MFLLGSFWLIISNSYAFEGTMSYFSLDRSFFLIAWTFCYSAYAFVAVMFLSKT